MITFGGTASTVVNEAMVLPARVCPVAPPGAQAHVDTILGYVLWGVGICFIVGIILGIAAFVGGRFFGMRHASTAGVLSVVLVFIAVIAYFVAPSILDAMMGDGCVVSAPLLIEQLSTSLSI
ncbi:hypothetical protein [Ornithinimicrobium murale]|uniref:hypothetical protein n=1 Tax=Ornithinimicrobium murale TaxID=1050153 RepID=UPI001EDF4E26|nr:hypothetical protein [Ornithinimicrobium murale]